MPNILQSKRFKDSRNRAKESEPKLSKGEINRIYEKCIENGYLLEDEKIDINKLSKSGREKVSKMVTNASDELHPLTFIITQDNQQNLVKTKDLLENININTSIKREDSR